MADTERFKPYTATSFADTSYWRCLSDEMQEALLLISQVLPFRTNDHVLSQLIDWTKVPDDPVFRLTFPHRDMLTPGEYSQLRESCLIKKDKAATERLIRDIRYRMNPHPSGQLSHNVPTHHGKPLPGLQHKYRETVLFFPAAGQTCHAYCSFCFRWPQFIGMEELKFSARESDQMAQYLQDHPEVSDVLITGGDPMVMNASSLASYLEPVLNLDHVRNIRIGTKALSYWPQRFVRDRDADELLRLFERVVKSGRSLHVMAHFSHPNEMQPKLVEVAIRRILNTGAHIKMQSPVLRHINSRAEDWVAMWTTGTRLGLVPYYMFVERDTGPYDYFKIPLEEAYGIFKSAYQTVSGLSRTVRGPSMSATPGKVVVDGVVTIGSEKLFVLQFLQARRPDWVRRPFFARYDSQACWLDELKPAFGEKRFFFELEEPVPELPRPLIAVLKPFVSTDDLGVKT